jgi:hypothetical protein
MSAGCPDMDNHRSPGFPTINLSEEWDIFRTAEKVVSIPRMPRAVQDGLLKQKE